MIMCAGIKNNNLNTHEHSGAVEDTFSVLLYKVFMIYTVCVLMVSFVWYSCAESVLNENYHQ